MELTNVQQLQHTSPQRQQNARMTKPPFGLQLAIYLLTLLTISLTAMAMDRPNIIIVFADDISARELPIYESTVWSPPLRGNTSDPHYRARTPVLDRLAKEGCWIKTAWASVVCSPSRAMMMTGRYAHRHKWWGNKSKGLYLDPHGKELPWPLYLSSPKQIGHVAQEAGYGTYWAGKTQMAGDLRRYGFDQGCFTPGSLADRDNPFTDFKLEYKKNDGKKQLLNIDSNQPVDTYLQHGWYWYPHVRLMNHDGKDFQWWPNTPETEESFGLGTYGPDVELEYIFDFMEKQHQQDKPFFVYHTTHLGHGAYDWLHPENGQNFPGTPVVNWDGQQYTRIQPNITGDAGQYDDHGTVTPPGIHHHINYLDYQAWLYQNKLKELGIAENTIFIFCADNGTATYGKNSTDRQKGTHVPMIISAPGMTKKGLQDVLVNMSDLLPTIAELTGVELPADYEINGESMVPFLFGEKTEHRDWLYGYKDSEQIIRGTKVMRDGRGKWWDVDHSPADLISFPEITDWQSVSEAHRAERDKLLAVLPQFDQKTNGKNGPGGVDKPESQKKKGKRNKKRERKEKKKGKKSQADQTQKKNTAQWTVAFEDNFDGRSEIGDQYYVPEDNSGAWTIQDDHLVGKQVKDNHGSVMRASVDFSDADIQFDFRFRGASRFNFVIDDKNEKTVHAGHICRASITPKSLLISDDRDGYMNKEVRKQRKDENLSEEKAAALETRMERTRRTVPIEVGDETWHTLRLRIRGDVMKAFLDGQMVTSLRSSGFAHPTKEKCGFTVNGESVDFDNLVIKR